MLSLLSCLLDSGIKMIINMTVPMLVRNYNYNYILKAPFCISSVVECVVQPYQKALYFI